MRVKITIENSEGMEVTIFDENVERLGEFGELLRLLRRTLLLDEDLRRFIEVLSKRGEASG